MKWSAFVLSGVAGLAMQQSVAADFSFVGTYSTDQRTPEVTREFEGITITLPADQEDLLPHLTPLFSLYRESRRLSSGDEVSAFREMIAGKEEEIASLVHALLGLDVVRPGFSEDYDDTVRQIDRVLELWERWSGDLSHVHLHDRPSSEVFWNEDTRVLDFGTIQYSFANPGNVNLSILPPFASRIGAGVDKLNPDAEDITGFRWDIGLFAPPGTSARVAADDIAALIPVLTDLQHEVAKQLGTRWIRYYLIENMLRHEIAYHWFNEAPENEPLIHAVARLYLDRFLRLSDPQRVPMLFPNLVHFPVEKSDSLPVLFSNVESIDPLASIDPAMNAAASRVLMLGLLKCSPSPDGPRLPFQQFAAKQLPVPEGGFDRETFAGAVRQAYPEFDRKRAEAAHEVAALMRNNTLLPDDHPAPPGGRLDLPSNYHSFTFGDVTMTAPAGLSGAIGKLGPEWSRGLKEAAETLRHRFDRELIPPLSFAEEDLASLRDYGIDVSRSDVNPWIVQTAVSNNFEQALAALFQRHRVEVWFEEDLKAALKGRKHGGPFTLDQNTGVIEVNLAFSFPATPTTTADVETYFSGLSELEPPVLPVILPNRDVLDRSLAEQVEAIRAGDYLVGRLISGAGSISREELGAPPARFMDEEETFFVIIHEVVEGFLIRRIIGSPDRRWFCDGLANWIAVQECDRRFGPGTGEQVLSGLFPAGEVVAFGDQVDLPGWKALENQQDDVSKANGLEAAHYAAATRIMQRALSDREPDFVREWLEQIRKTAWIRTHAGTVIEAHDLLTNGDLGAILTQAAP